MKNAVLLLLIIGASINSSAQNKRFFGIILDENTKQPIPWVNLYVNQKGIGTVSNIEGQFSINIPQDAIPIALKISCVGYKSKSIVLNDDEKNELEIFLTLDTRFLNEIEIKPTSARQLISDAIKRIPDNYPSIANKIIGFYRESLRYDSINYVYISEGVFEALKESYRQAHHSGQVKLLKARKKEFEDSVNTLKKIHFYGGPHTIHSRDFVSNRFEFIREDKLKDYSYTIDDITSLNDKEIYKISFKPLTSSGLYQGVLFLDINSGAFIGARYSLTKAGIKSEKSFGVFSRYIRREFLINYMQINNKWVVNNMWQQGLLRVNEVKDTVIFASEFVTTGVDTIDTSTFPYDERFQHGDFFIDRANNLDPAFWNNYNILKENTFIQTLQDKETNDKSLSTNYTPNSDQENRPEVKRRKVKYLFDLALASSFPNYSTSDISLTVNGGTNFAYTIDESPPVSFGLYSSLEMYLSKCLRLSLGSTSLFGKLQVDNLSIGIGYEYGLSLNSRPLRVIAGLGVSYNNIRQPIQTFDGSLSLAGEDVSGSIEVSLQKIYYALQPNLKLSLELNRRWDFFIGANVLLDLNTKDKILFKEKDGFFLSRNKISVDTNDPNINLIVNGVSTEEIPISPSSVFLNIGFTFKYNR